MFRKFSVLKLYHLQFWPHFSLHLSVCTPWPDSRPYYALAHHKWHLNSNCTSSSTLCLPQNRVRLWRHAMVLPKLSSIWPLGPISKLSGISLSVSTHVKKLANFTDRKICKEDFPSHLSINQTHEHQEHT